MHFMSFSNICYKMAESTLVDIEPLWGESICKQMRIYIISSQKDRVLSSIRRPECLSSRSQSFRIHLYVFKRVVDV
jgi:hypothetical protein